VEAAAARLRMIQTDLADQPEEVREAHLREEIGHAIAKMVPDERRAFLAALQERFPAWESAASAAAAAHAEAEGVTSASDRRELRDPVFLAERLAEASKGMSERERETVLAVLGRAGLAPAGDGAGASVGAAFAEAVGLEASGVDAGRALAAAAELVQVIDRLDQLAWSTWKQMAPKSTLRRREAVGKTLARFVSEDEGASRAQLSEDLERFRQLTAALLSSFSRVGPLAHQIVAPFAPEEISRFARQEKKMLESMEVACWRKYQELAGSLERGSVEAEMFKGLSGYAESLISGAGR